MRQSDPARDDRKPRDLEQECETWDWARAAGVSAQELRQALRESLPASSGSRPA